MAHVSIQSENRENLSGQPSGGCIIADNRRSLHSKKPGWLPAEGFQPPFNRGRGDKRPAANLPPGDRST